MAGRLLNPKQLRNILSLGLRDHDPFTHVHSVMQLYTMSDTQTTDLVTTFLKFTNIFLVSFNIKLL